MTKKETKRHKSQIVRTKDDMSRQILRGLVVLVFFMTCKSWGQVGMNKFNER